MLFCLCVFFMYINFYVEDIVGWVVSVWGQSIDVFGFSMVVGYVFCYWGQEFYLFIVVL